MTLNWSHWLEPVFTLVSHWLEPVFTLVSVFILVSYWFFDGYLCGVLQDGQQALLDASDQFQSGVEVFWFQKPDTRGQVSALQQSLLWEHTQHQSAPVRPVHSVFV